MSDSYKIGQMVLKPKEKEYTTNISLKAIDEEAEPKEYIYSYLNGNISMAIFEDKYIIPVNKFNNLENYFLSTKLKTEGNYIANYNIKLVKIKFVNENTVSFEKERVIKSNLIATNDSQNIDLIFNCIEDDTYDAIVFEIIRNSDEINQKDNTFIGRKLNIESLKLQTILNLINTSIVITELGLQGEPGQLFTIEGEEIRIGKSGVYEMHFENIGINNIGVIPQDNTLILDYKYKEAK